MLSIDWASLVRLYASMRYWGVSIALIAMMQEIRPMGCGQRNLYVCSGDHYLFLSHFQKESQS